MRTVFVLKRKLVYGGEELLAVYGNKARAVKAFTKEANQTIRNVLSHADEDTNKEALAYFKSMNDWWSVHTLKTATVERWGKEWTGPQVRVSAMYAEFDDEPNKEYLRNGTADFFMQRIVEFHVAEQGEWDDTSTVALVEVVLE